MFVTGGDVPVKVFHAIEYREFFRLFVGKPDRTRVTALDYEGSSLDAMAVDFMVAGIGLSDPDNTAYLVLRSFDEPEYGLTPEIQAFAGRMLKWLNDNRRLTVFNLKYEVGATQNKATFGVYLDKVVDTMQLCTTLDARGGLKKVASDRLDVPEWRDDIDDWRGAWEVVLTSLKPAMHFRKVEEQILRDKGYEAMMDLVEHAEKEESKRNQALEKALLYLDRAGTYLYEKSEWHRRFAEFCLRKIDAGETEVDYSEVPVGMIAPYCGRDCYYTRMLYGKMMAELEEQGLIEAAEYYNLQMYLGHDMQTNGIAWDDDRASDLEEQFKGKMMQALKQFILSRNARKVLGLVETEPGVDEPEERTLEREVVRQKLMDIRSTTDLNVLKKYFNPDSTATKATELLSQILVTSRLKICMMLHEVNNILLSEEEGSADAFPVIGRIIQKILSAEDKSAECAKVPGWIKALHKADKLGPKERAFVGTYSGYSLPNAQAETIQHIADAFLLFSSANIDDPATWPEEFEPVFYYKMYKKVSKCVSAFVNGAGGRGNVWVSRGDEPGYYTRDFRYDRKLGVEPGLTAIFEPSYGVNMAKTKRWTAAYHGVPTMSDSQTCWVSRYGDDGIFLGGDFSQHELRIIASVSKDPAMIQAFLDGKDLHLMVASRMYHIAEDDVTPNQRAVAKAANFGLVYLKSAETFAQEYLNGDVDAAKRLFDGIFQLFSGMKEWRNNCIAELDKAVALAKKHRQRTCTVVIRTLWGDPIHHTFNHHNRREYNDTRRYVVNWVIQSTASNLAALALGATNAWLKEEGMHTRPFGFTHDCEKFDVHLSELFTMMEKIPEVSEEYLLDRFSLPVKLDMEIGTTLGGLVGIKRRKGKDSFVQGDRLLATLEGTADDVDQVLIRLGRHYGVTSEVVSEKVKKNSWKDLFSIKGCYFLGMGQESVQRVVNVEIVRG